MKTIDNMKSLSRILSTAPDTGKRMGSVLARIKVCIIVLLLYLGLNFLHIGCPIKYMTGMSCPGCGMTRAVTAALQLHFREAFYYHPLFLLAPIMLLLFLFNDYLKPGLTKAVWAVIITMFILTYIYRLLFYENNVVVIDFSSGLVVKLLHNIINVGGFK